MPKEKGKMENVEFQENLRIILKQITLEKLKRFSISINLGVNSLFCQIGTLISNEINGGDLNEENSLTKDIAKDLQPIFGDYLDDKNLSLMNKFARKCASEKMRELTAFINWKYIPYFLGIEEDVDVWIFYMELICLESLTPAELGEKIRKGLVVDVEQVNHDKYITMCKHGDVLYESALELYFGKEDGHNFRKLFEPKISAHKSFDLLSENQHGNHGVVINIYEKILAFQTECNHELNMEFNLMFWEIGIEIIRLSKLFNVSAITMLTQEADQKWPYLFTNDDLYYSFKFVEQYGEDNPPPIALIQTVSWPYLKLLLEIDGVERQKYMANQILENGILLQDLKEKISESLLDFDMDVEKLDKALIKKVIVIETTEKNFTTKGTMEEVEMNVNDRRDLNRNIFKNRELLKFLKN